LFSVAPKAEPAEERASKKKKKEQDVYDVYFDRLAGQWLTGLGKSRRSGKSNQASSDDLALSPNKRKPKDHDVLFD
jgi:hypothetical protein